MILYSTNSIKNADGESAHLKVTGSEQDELKVLYLDSFSNEEHWCFNEFFIDFLLNYKFTQKQNYFSINI